jgi:hypothetical protein
LDGQLLVRLDTTTVTGKQCDGLASFQNSSAKVTERVLVVVSKEENRNVLRGEVNARRANTTLFTMNEDSGALRHFVQRGGASGTRVPANGSSGGSS